MGKNFRFYLERQNFFSLFLYSWCENKLFHVKFLHSKRALTGKKKFNVNDLGFHAIFFFRKKNFNQ